MIEDEPINEYRIKVTVRNNLILNAIENAGYKNVSAFCRAVGIHKTALTELIAMRKPPLNQSGEFSDNAKALMEELCLLPTDLWTSEQLTLKLKRNSAQRDVSSEGMRAALGMHADEMLELMKPDDPDEAVLKHEMVSLVEEQLESLSPRSVLVLRMRYGIGCEEHTYEEIGDKFDLSKERIRQIEAKALRHLKHPSRSDKLRQLLPHYEKPPHLNERPKEFLCGVDRGHMFYTNQNRVSVCAHCGAGEERLKKIEEIAQLKKKEAV
jgi:RNA polymerase sigma factor (sigma-70 family)